MRTWKNALEAAQDALQEMNEAPNTVFCGYCRWWYWPGEMCMHGGSNRYTDYVMALDAACGNFTPAKGCVTCRYYLEGGQCASSLERECRDGGFEAWEPKT